MLSFPCNDKYPEKWIIKEDDWRISTQRRIESIFSLGNGYMGVRSAAEESYKEQKRGTFVSGTFDKFEPQEVTELPNVPDQMNIELYENALPVKLVKNSKANSYLLNLYNGTAVRTAQFKTGDGVELNTTFTRYVSKADLHLFAQKMEITASKDVVISVKCGIDGEITNTGAQHFGSREKMIYGTDTLQAFYETLQSHILFCLRSSFAWKKNGESMDVNGQLEITSRSVYFNFSLALKAGETYSLEKINSIYTSVDKEFENKDFTQIKEESLILHNESAANGFEAGLQESEKEWKKFWDNHDIRIASKDITDQIAVRYAIFHMAVMTPAHDNRMNIGAKGLSGEGYKGHTFWDTEIFLLPFWIETEPQVARSLLEYRYLSLEGARSKARENGYLGAMYPWESAWVTDGEATPKWGAADVVTGKPLPIICGDIEQHITCDVAYGVWYYYQMTGDKDFMEKCGYEIIFDTAIYWQSRWEWVSENNRYEILNVIGPDEYSEHVNNNAYTNHMSAWNVRLAISYFKELQEKEPKLFKQLEEKLHLSDYYPLWVEKVEKLYLPAFNEEGLLPQDDAYLTLPAIDIEKYKTSKTRADIIKDYNMEQISQLQVAKQADVLALLYLRNDLGDYTKKKINFDYYEKRCLHDSSLSYAIHSILACDFEENQLSLDLFNKAKQIDLNDNPKSSVDGIHAASMGGVWQCVVHGFGGLRYVDEATIRIEPHLPEIWEELSYCISWHGAEIEVCVDKEKIKVCSSKQLPGLSIVSNGNKFSLEEEIVIPLLLERKN